MQISLKKVIGGESKLKDRVKTGDYTDNSISPKHPKTGTNQPTI
jgi:hypothetical protein